MKDTFGGRYFDSPISAKVVSYLKVFWQYCASYWQTELYDSLMAEAEGVSFPQISDFQDV